MFTKIDHIGIAVTALDDILKFYQDALGLHLHEIEEVPEQKVRVAMFPVGETNLEFLEPTSPDSPIAKFLEKKGQGIHHISIGVEDIDRVLAELKARGARLINETPVVGAGGKRIAFVHPASTSGILLELSQAPLPR
ncbi:MAG TPA: methylmalonyl-CoA epimerase [Acidobacteriota bacterium]|nr:methylmalonyl-CoA epimerase [Acidobacteriota bacterium]HNR38232.1 methylmalonyl-CoA epimerase [Acidobacteriota bacterium]HNT99863.1 methylmalonyl-CoA epimerase [Acidobacteriota bacterium]HPB28630.1 methylmalonyl-CoA epimerase [Acidobacteriota bacterium]HQO26474.1 methylmalonyl-CoA epimerase [Acidobacteriota bacterium]